MIKLASAAKSDLALSAGLLVLLVPATVLFLPLYVPLAMAHPSLRGLSYVPSSVWSLGRPLLATLVLPVLLAVGGTVSTVAVLAVMVFTFGANLPELAWQSRRWRRAGRPGWSLLRIVKTGAILAGVLWSWGRLPSDIC